MKMIYKYDLNELDLKFGKSVDVEIPGYVKIVHFDRDMAGILCAWAQVDDNPMYTYTVPVYVLPTGMAFNAAANQASYHSTMNDKGFFWHLYVGAPKEMKVAQ